MATFSLLLMIAAAAAVAVLISPALSQNCTSQIFSNSNTTFDHCMNLPTLHAQLHWTHAVAPANTLSFAFIIPNPSGYWTGWALNPYLNMDGMMGAQAFVVSNVSSSIAVNTYNISTISYQVDGPSNISYPVLSMSAQHVNGNTTIFATLRLPDAKPVLNQVWQLGKNATLAMHDYSDENLRSKGKLTLAGPVAESPAGSPAGSPSGSPPPLAESPRATGGVGGNGTGGSSGGARVGLGLGSYGVVLVLLWASSCFGF